MFIITIKHMTVRRIRLDFPTWFDALFSSSVGVQGAFRSWIPGTSDCDSVTSRYSVAVSTGVCKVRMISRTHEVTPEFRKPRSEWAIPGTIRPTYIQFLSCLLAFDHVSYCTKAHRLGHTTYSTYQVLNSENFHHVQNVGQRFSWLYSGTYT